MAKHNLLGKSGEEEAVKYLISKGYDIIACNWRHKRIEIDIIAGNDDYIVFVEVKTRSSSEWGNPEDSVDDLRIKRMVEAADYYVIEHHISLPVRFDVVALVQNGLSFSVKHIDDAFMAPLN